MKTIYFNLIFLPSYDQPPHHSTIIITFKIASLARNTQLILQDETHLTKVADPLGLDEMLDGG